MQLSVERLRQIATPLACLPMVLFFFYSNPNDLAVCIGRFHPIILHFPIGILFSTTLIEMMLICSRGRLKFATYPLLFIGTLSAVLAMTLGILLMVGEQMEGALVINHLRWGIATTVGALIALALRSRSAYSTTLTIRIAYRITLLLTCSILGWASHLGGSITHGETYLTEYLPWATDASASELQQRLAKPLAEKELYHDVIAPIFEAKCCECHATRSFKGRLIMDTYAGLLAGGTTGPALVPNQPEKSLTLARVLLPLADEDHMPPAGKDQLTDDEIDLLKWWIDQGAPEQGTAQELGITAELETSIMQVTQALQRALKTEPTEEHQELSSENIIHQRELYADKVHVLQQKYPGIIRYANAQSTSISIVSYHEPWSDADLVAISPIAALIEELILPKNTLTKTSAGVINQMSTLKKMDLRNSSVHDDLIAELNLPNLRRLNLFETQLTDAGVLRLSTLTGLRKLYLGNNNLTSETVEKLQAALPSCEIIFSN